LLLHPFVFDVLRILQYLGELVPDFENGIVLSLAQAIHAASATFEIG